MVGVGRRGTPRDTRGETRCRADVAQGCPAETDGRTNEDEEGKERENRRGRIERLWKAREREERKKNIVVKGLKEKREDKIGEIKEILKEIGVEAKVEEVSLEIGRKEWGGMAVVREG